MGSIHGKSSCESEDETCIVVCFMRSLWRDFSPPYPQGGHCMTPHLLAAEADRIQDFIFCASRLREVVGGSQLLSRFCQEGTRALLQHYQGDLVQDLIVHDGGAFRI